MREIDLDQHCQGRSVISIVNLALYELDKRQTE